METVVKDYGYVKTVYFGNQPIFDIWSDRIDCVSNNCKRATAKFKLKCLK